jgi:hypothetical protein
MNTITTSLAVSKKLKEAGWKWKDAPSTFCWWLQEDEEPRVTQSWCDKGFCIPAPTAEEVLRELPSVIRSEQEYWLTIRREYEHDKRMEVVYEYDSDDVKSNSLHHTTGDTLANAAAELWIYLKTNDLL